jgi:hypothetical protein
MGSRGVVKEPQHSLGSTHWDRAVAVSWSSTPWTWPAISSTCDFRAEVVGSSTGMAAVTATSVRKVGIESFILNGLMVLLRYVEIEDVLRVSVG